MLVATPAAVAFGVLVWTSVDPSLAAAGAMAGVLGAVALGVMAPLVGRTAGLVSAPCAPAAAVLSSTALWLIEGGSEPDRLLALLALTCFLAALLQGVLGLVGAGKVIKFIPHPVVAGYLAAVGLLIALGQLPNLLGLPPELELTEGLLSPSTWSGVAIACGLVTIVVTVAAPLVTKLVPAPILGLLAGIGSYFGLAALTGGSLLSLEGNHLVIGALETQGSFLAAVRDRLQGLRAVGLSDVERVLVPSLTLGVLLSIDTLKTGVLLDTMTRSRHDSNRSLVGQGAGNLAAFLVGGMSGAGTSGPTLVNISSGGNSWISGLLAGVFALLAFLLLAPLLAWIPLGALAGILLVVAFRMVDWSALRLLAHAGTRLDFTVIATVVVVAAVQGLLVAAVVGLVLSILLFLRDQMRTSVIRRVVPLSKVHSKTRRLRSERRALEREGEQGLLVEVQGNLFFGTTDRLYSELEEDLTKRRFLLLDLRRVGTFDYTAAHMLTQMQERLEDAGGGVLLSGIPTGLGGRTNVEHYLRQVGVLGDDESRGVRRFEYRDTALEWIEDQLLQGLSLTQRFEKPQLELEEIELFADLEPGIRESLRSCLELKTLEPGEALFRQGEPGDAMYLVRSGAVMALLPLPEGKAHHVATFSMGDFFGEMAFLDRGVRSADVVAKGRTELYVLAREPFDVWAAEHPAMAAETHARLARAIAHRLRDANLELGALQER